MKRGPTRVSSWVCHSVERQTPPNKAFSARVFLEQAGPHTFPESSPSHHSHLPCSTSLERGITAGGAEQWNGEGQACGGTYLHSKRVILIRNYTSCCWRSDTHLTPSSETWWCNLLVSLQNRNGQEPVGRVSQCKELFSNHWIKMWGKHKNHYSNSFSKIWRGRVHTYAQSHMDSQKKDQEPSVQELGATHQEDYYLNTWAILEELEKKPGNALFCLLT